MKKTLYLIFTLCCLSSLHSFGQDRIITTDGDTLNCKITKENKEYVYFTFRHNDEVRNTLLPLNKIVSAEKSYYAYPDVSPAEYPGRVRDYSSFRLAVNGGWGYRIGKAPKGTKDYVDKLRSGLSLGLDAHFFLDRLNGLGIEYFYFHKNSTYYALKENTNIHFIGPSYCLRSSSKSGKNAFLLSAALGYSGYTNDAKGIPADGGTIDGKLSGGTFGTTFALGYDIGISPKMALGIKVALHGANLTKISLKSNGVKVTTKLEEGEEENISTLNVTVGLRFRN